MARVTYSISRLAAFDQCRLQYKYRYIDRLPAQVESIEAFLGSRVHEALQEFYERIRTGAVESKEWLERRFAELWRKKIHGGLRIMKEGQTADDYLRLGQKFLAEYYDAHRPFDRTEVLKTEQLICFEVSLGGRSYDFCGVLDRLDWNAQENIYEIHDYKTSSDLPGQEDADRDPQLGLYHLAVTSFYPEAREVKLVWHYLAFNTEIESRRSVEALNELKEALVARIAAIEACREFPAAKSALCSWCGYQPVCPEWSASPASPAR